MRYTVAGAVGLGIAMGLALGAILRIFFPLY